MAKSVDVYIEKGQKKVFAGAIEWPGWCRSGKDEAGALRALLDYGPRYARALKGSGEPFRPPGKISELRIAQRLKGDSTTDFGAPGMAPKADDRAVGSADVRRLTAILEACWRTFDASTKAASGKRLRTGPRGGGRDLEKMRRHVVESNDGYLAQLGAKLSVAAGTSLELHSKQGRKAAADGIAAGARGEFPAVGPRGGKRWSVRYFVRRSAWHLLDHAWEIEDRIE